MDQKPEKHQQEKLRFSTNQKKVEKISLIQLGSESKEEEKTAHEADKNKGIIGDNRNLNPEKRLHEDPKNNGIKTINNRKIETGIQP